MPALIQDFLANFWQILESISTLAAALLAFFALHQAVKISQGQQKLSQEIHEQQQRLSEAIHDQEMLLAQRQVFIQLFEHTKNLRTINPKNPVWVHVIEAVNILDLIGICWEGELVDREIILRLYREMFVETYERIERCVDPPRDKVEKDGKEMLRDSRAATNLYNHLRKEHVNRNLPTPLRD